MHCLISPAAVCEFEQGGGQFLRIVAKRILTADDVARHDANARLEVIERIRQDGIDVQLWADGLG